MATISPESAQQPISQLREAEQTSDEFWTYMCIADRRADLVVDTGEHADDEPFSVSLPHFPFVFRCSTLADVEDYIEKLPAELRSTL